MVVIRYLLDTDFCIHAIRKRTKAVARILIEHGQDCAISDISLYELYYGAETYEVPATRLAVIEEFAAGFQTLPFDRRAAQHAGTIRADLRKRGEMIGNSDILIAAIARAHDLILLTGNKREFARVKELKIESWR